MRVRVGEGSRKVKIYERMFSVLFLKCFKFREILKRVVKILVGDFFCFVEGRFWNSLGIWYN